MSASEDSGENMGIPDARLEKALRDAVEQTFKSDPEQLTVKRIRSKVEQELELDDGFFKNSATWNTRSKEVIQSEVVR